MCTGVRRRGHGRDYYIVVRDPEGEIRRVAQTESEKESDPNAKKRCLVP